jgi:N-acetylmuramic acid 6-phosphate etherase
MVALGKVRGNLMVDLAISNAKLRDRAVRLVANLANCDQAVALERLQLHHWNVRAALQD